MDITGFLSNYHAALSTYDSAANEFFAQSMIAGALLVCPMVLIFALVVISKVGGSGRWTVVDYIFCGWVLLCGALLGALIGAVVGGLIGEAKADAGLGMNRGDYVHTKTYELQAQVENYYGVDIPEDKFAEAWLEADDSDITAFGAQHNGKEKSLGIRVDEAAGKIWVYQGNVALDPAKG